MNRPLYRSLISRGLRAIDRIAEPDTAHAHCDIPCGIYDPHFAQIAALSVIRMNQLIDAMEAPGDDKGSRQKAAHAMSRWTAAKEEHAEICKREVRIIWGDYFKPEHAEKFPELHDLTWKIMKAGGKARQEINMEAAQDLLAQVQRFAEIFWETKGVATKRQPSNQAVGGEIVVPSN